MSKVTLFGQRSFPISEPRRRSVAASLFVIACIGATSQLRGAEVPVVRPRILSVTGRLVEGRDISFQRLPPTAGLSQTRVSLITQDDDGFLWFGTQSGLNRFD